MKKQTLTFLLITLFGLSFLTSCGGGGGGDTPHPLAGKTFVKDSGTTFTIGGTDVTDQIQSFTLTVNAAADGGSVSIQIVSLSGETATITNVGDDSITLSSGLSNWGTTISSYSYDATAEKLSFTIASSSAKVGTGTVTVTNLDEQ